PEATALYLFPTKALAQDQLRQLRELHAHASEIPLAQTYDGDVSRGGREKVRAEARLILSNPDMLHVTLMPNHTRWHRFLTNLRYVVIDEIHAMRGIFGSHCSHIFRRLHRICSHYQSGSPRLQFICCSATIANPREHAEALIGHDTTLIEDDGSPRGQKHFVFWNPPMRRTASGQRRSAHVEAVELLADLVRSGFRSIAFTKWWGATELVARYTKEMLDKEGLADRIASYRGGYLASHRREIEGRLFNGDLNAVVSTNALELGINIGGLDAAVIVGFPGTISATWQQAGRAGRTTEDSIAFLVAYDTSINQYLMNYPAYFFAKDSEKALVAPRNRHVLTGQLACASHELPIEPRELEAFVAGKVTGHIPARDIDAAIKRQHAELEAQIAPGVEAPKEREDDEVTLAERKPMSPLMVDDAADAIAEAGALMELMEEEGVLRYTGGRWHYAETTKPAYLVSIRSITTENYTIVDITNPEEETIIGQIDQLSAYPILHPEAIYFHLGEQY
ncbi:MAG TPA: DEAD/DEAH box helicase, partial [Armatimonadota bacterium]|nr:DEAD/DEAH box helicase [Armatimonadota bacterium]